MKEITIGTKFKMPGKNSKECSVIDIYKTFNSTGKLVKVNYVATHTFCGQVIISYDIPASAILRNIIN